MAILTTGAYAQVIKSNDSKPVGSTTKPTVVKTVSVEAATTYVATAYSLRGKMANGQGVHAGAIAADPRILPLGSVVYIEGMGTFTVKDTGGAIKGRRIDIWMNSRKNALQFGKRPVKLRVLSKPSRKIRT